MTARFHRIMDNVFADMSFVAIYVNHIVIFSESKAGYIDHVKTVINRLRDLDVLINAKKSRCSQ